MKNNNTSTSTSQGQQFQEDSIGYTFIDSIRKGRYVLTATIGDLVDNSIDATADNVWVITQGPFASIERIILIDDGFGMDEEYLKGSYKLGFTRTNRTNKQNGKFGVGGTMGCLGIAGNKITISRDKNGQVFARSYDIDQIKLEDAWGHNEIAPPSDLVDLLDESVGKGNTGTLICLSNFDRDNFGRRRDNIQTRIKKYCAETYCEYITRNKVTIHIDGKVVEPRDPLCWFHPDTIQVYDEPINGTNARLRIVNLKNVPKEIQGKAQSRQGGYIYRCDRIIERSITGENQIWNKKVPNRHQGHGWCRWGVYYDASDDEIFNTSYDKSSVNPSQDLLDRIGEIVTREMNVIFKEKNRKDKTLKTKEERKKQEELTNNIANQLSKEPKKTIVSVKTDAQEVEIEIENKVVPLKLPQNPIPNIKVKVVSLGALGEPAMIVANEDQTESKFVMQINSEHPYISKYYMSYDSDSLLRSAVEAWLLSLYLTFQGMPDDEDCSLMDFRERFSKKLRQATLSFDRS